MNSRTKDSISFNFDWFIQLQSLVNPLTGKDEITLSGKGVNLITVGKFGVGPSILKFYLYQGEIY